MLAPSRVTPQRDTPSVFDQARRGSDGPQIDDVLSEMRRQAHDSADLGGRFERLCQGVLGALSDGDGRRVFDRVDRWDDWAGREGSGGGIDLVAHRNNARGDDAMAIQCHCCSDNRLISKQDVASFLAHSGSARFRARMLIHTATGLSAELQREIDDPQKPCHVVDLAEMRRWKLDWWAVAEAVGAVALPHRSPSRSTAAGQQGGDTEPDSSAGSLLRKASRWLLSRGVGVAAIAAGTLMVFSGADMGALLIIGGLLVFARRHGTRRHTTAPSANPPPGRRHRRATSRHRSHSDDWSDDEPDWDDDEDRDDEWEREDREFRAFSERDPAERDWRDRNDEWDTDDRWDDTDDEWDADDRWDWGDDEPPRRPTSRGRGRRSSWENDDDYI